MMFRPVSARWFEMLTTREDLTNALATLARTRSIELETQSGKDVRFNIPDLQNGMEEYGQLARRYQAYWPEVVLDTSIRPGSPVKIIDQAVLKIRAWSQEAAEPVQLIESAEAEANELELLKEMLEEQQDNALDYSLLPGSGPLVSARIFVLPIKTVIKTFPKPLLIRSPAWVLHAPFKTSSCFPR